jgi:hypothetical protein
MRMIGKYSAATSAPEVIQTIGYSTKTKMTPPLRVSE